MCNTFSTDPEVMYSRASMHGQKERAGENVTEAENAYRDYQKAMGDYKVGWILLKRRRRSKED